MILAAGYGRRLRPLTDSVPKALVDVAGTTMLERVAGRLIAAGADRLIINIHHHAGQVREFLREHDDFGVEVRISEEPGAPLETGGGLARARPHFRGESPFLVHNVDVITDLDLVALYHAHLEADPLATLAVSERETRRLLRFDDHGLQARVDGRSGVAEEVRPRSGPARDRAFGGIHVLSPRILDLIPATGAYSIMGPYLALAGGGHRILPYDMGDALWLEIGDPERLRRAREALTEREGEARGG